jgi:hypothetical protein
MSLKERIHEVEGDSEEAFRARRQLVRLLVDGIVIEDKRKGEEPRVRITYRFDEPDGTDRERDGELCKVFLNSDRIPQGQGRGRGRALNAAVAVE